ncbi:MAG: hypothetical protein ACLFQV_00435, partial [Vulcanimicrobiota bacterium]
MASKKKKKKQNEKNNIDETNTQISKDKEEQENFSLPMGVIYLILGLFFAFFLWSAYSGLTQGNFTLIFLLVLAFNGLAVAILARYLQKSGYYGYYRIVSVIFFIMVAVTYYFMPQLDGFLFAIIAILAAILVVFTVLPLFFEGASVETLVGRGLAVTFIFMLAMLFLGNKVLIPREKTIQFNNTYPFGIIFGKDSKDVIIYGDNRFFDPDAEKVQFSINREIHPDLFMEEAALRRSEEVKNIRGGKEEEKKKKDKDFTEEST